MMRPLMAALSLALICSPAEAKQHRSKQVLREFQIQHPCPSTGRQYGACPGYQKDHVIALECGGADAVANLQWLSIEAHKVKTRDDNRKCRTRLPNHSGQ